MQTMIASFWHHLLTASSASEAIDRASLHSLLDLRTSSLPIPFNEMSPNAQKNLRAICRAYEIRIGGIQSDGWELWREGANELGEWGKVDLDIRQKRARVEGRKVGQTSMAPHVSKKPRAEILPLISEEALVNNKYVKERKGTDAPFEKNLSDTDNPRAERKENAGKEGLGTEEQKSAEMIRTWAGLSPHTDPPQEAVEVVLRSVEPRRVLRSIVSQDASPLIRAAVISSFTERIGTSFASAMMTEIIIPYLETLTAPAPREMMAAVVKFSAYHWRAAVALYAHFGDRDKLINGAVAELLARVAGGLTSEAALSSLKAYSKCIWGEDGIKVIEALMAKCKNQPGVLSAIVPSLEKNVIGMEKSVRFGKLLFTTVKDFPVVENEYEQVLESVAARSKVFLAKRALSHIKNKK
ncbi:hypothetical protein FGB62_94g054 [Gracilaria domingensis]|nr:hypothetical protein FGB62_94g054 [Gracilaria domingensis]